MRKKDGTAIMVRLGDVCTVVSGTTPKSTQPEYWDGDLNWVTPAELTDESDVIYESQRKITSQAVADSSLKSFPAGTVLLSSRAPIGKVAIAGTEMYCNQGFKNLICSDKIYNRYLYHFLKNNTDYLNSLGRGATFKEISKGIVENIEIPLPSLDDQRKIAAVLDKVSDLIAKRRQQLDKLDEMVKAKFVEMFGDININDKGWKVQPLGELCTIVRGGSPRPIEKYLGGNIPWIKIGDATSGENIYLYSTKEHIIQDGISRSRLVKAGSLIFANCGVSLGFARIITFDGCIHDGWLAMEDINLQLDKVFLLHTLNQMTEHFRKIAPAGTQPNLNTAIMKEYKQIVPPMQLQKEFILFVEQTEKTKNTISCSLEQMETLKKALMQEYFGECNLI